MRTFFLPGAGGNGQFWKPLAEELGGDYTLFSWPGLGNEKHDERVNSINDLVDIVDQEITQPVNVVAQSMGGLVAVLLAIRRPTEINRMVLFVTSAGVRMDKFDASNWRTDYREAFPNAANWIEEVHIDLTEELKCLDVPVLLVWGDSDPISPTSVGEHLNALLPDAKLQIVEGGDHDIGNSHARQLVSFVRSHFQA